MEKEAKWTFMVYMAGGDHPGDGEGRLDGNDDLTEMRKVGSTEKVNVVAQLDPDWDSDVKRYHIQRGGIDDEVDNLGKIQSATPEEVISFVSWAEQNYAAERYALVLWGHGSGWNRMPDRGARSARSRGYSAPDADEDLAIPPSRIFFLPAREKILRRSSPTKRTSTSEKGKAFRRGLIPIHGQSLDTIELGKVLAGAQKTLGQSLDLLGMDACLMGNLEVAYEAADHVGYMVASEGVQPTTAWPYDKVLQKLVKKPDLETPALASHIVDAYVEYYRASQSTESVSLSALDLSKIKLLTDPLDDLFTALNKHRLEAAGEIRKACKRDAHLWLSQYDIACFCEELRKVTTNEAVRRSAQNVLAALKRGADNFVIHRSYYGDGHAGYGGVSLYLPRVEIPEAYKELKYVIENTSRLSLLEDYITTYRKD